MALPRILTVQNGKVVIDESILSIPEIKEVWDIYQDIVPLQYLWARFDSESPYLNYDEVDRPDKVLQDFPCDINDFVMIKAINKCEELYDSPIRKILKGVKISIENLSNYLSTNEITDGRDGNLTQIIGAIKSVPQLLKAFQDAESAYLQEVQKNRAGMKSAVDEDFEADWD